MVSRKKQAQPEQPQPSTPSSPAPAEDFVLEDWVDLSEPVPDWLAADERSRPGSIDAHHWLVGQRAWREAIQAAYRAQQGASASPNDGGMHYHY